MMDYTHEVVADNGDLGKLYEITDTLPPGSTDEPSVLHVSTLDEIPVLMELTLNPRPRRLDRMSTTSAAPSKLTSAPRPRSGTTIRLYACQVCHQHQSELGGRSAGIHRLAR